MLVALHKYNINPSTHQENRVPIPDPIALCEDSAVIGTPFYIMAFMEGRIFTNPLMPEVPEETRREMCGILSSCHAVLEADKMS
jgi:aminoglycoside phosphotransferase (APT) family kinase protein